MTEIFDSELLGEGVLPTMRHAVRELLQARAVHMQAICTWQSAFTHFEHRRSDQSEKPDVELSEKQTLHEGC